MNFNFAQNPELSPFWPTAITKTKTSKMPPKSTNNWFDSTPKWTTTSFTIASLFTKKGSTMKPSEVAKTYLMNNFNKNCYCFKPLSVMRKMKSNMLRLCSAKPTKTIPMSSSMKAAYSTKKENTIWLSRNFCSLSTLSATTVNSPITSPSATTR